MSIPLCSISLHLCALFVNLPFSQILLFLNVNDKQQDMVESDRNCTRLINNVSSRWRLWQLQRHAWLAPLQPSIKTVKLFGNVLVGVLKRFFVKQAECLKGRLLNILLKCECLNSCLGSLEPIPRSGGGGSKGLVYSVLLQPKKIQPCNFLHPQEGWTNQRTTTID